MENTNTDKSINQNDIENFISDTKSIYIDYMVQDSELKRIIGKCESLEHLLSNNIDKEILLSFGDFLSQSRGNQYNYSFYQIEAEKFIEQKKHLIKLLSKCKDFQNEVKEILLEKFSFIIEGVIYISSTDVVFNINNINRLFFFNSKNLISLSVFYKEFTHEDFFKNKKYIEAFTLELTELNFSRLTDKILPNAKDFNSDSVDAKDVVTKVISQLELFLNLLNTEKHI